MDKNNNPASTNVTNHVMFLRVVHANHYKTAQTLLSAGYNPNYMGSTGLAAVHVTNQIPMLQLLVQYQGNINLSIPSSGNTPLHMAAYHNDHPCAVFLLRAGADPTLKNQRNQTAMDVASKPSRWDSMCCKRMVYTLLKQHLKAQIKTQVHDMLECPICMTVFKRPVTLCCGHTFCFSCITAVQDLSAAPSSFPCPVDRFPVPKALGFRVNVTMQKLLSDFG